MRETWRLGLGTLHGEVAVAYAVIWVVLRPNSTIPPASETALAYALLHLGKSPTPSISLIAGPGLISGSNPEDPP